MLLSVWAWGADPQEQFDQKYGEQVKKLTPGNAVDLVTVLITDAAGLRDDPATAEFILLKAAESCQRIFNPQDKLRAGESLLVALMRAANRHFARREYPEAAKVYQQALAVAKAIKSFHATAIAARNDIAAGRAKCDKQVSELKNKLQSDPQDPVAAKKLIMLLALDMDDPGSALEYLKSAPDAATRKNLLLAARNIYEIPLDQVKELANWYKSLMAGASLIGKATACDRALKYGQRFAFEHDQKDAQSLAMIKLLAEVGPLWEKQNPFHDELTTFVTGMGFSMKSDALGTWKLEPTLRRTEVSWEYVQFGKNGSCVSTALWNWTNNSFDDQPRCRLESIRGSWEGDNKLSITPGWQRFPITGLPYPRGNSFKTTCRYDDVLISIRMDRVLDLTPQEEMFKLLGNRPSTRIPGVWMGGDMDSTRFIFRDDGMVFEMLEQQPKGETRIRQLNIWHWKVQDGQLFIGGKEYWFPYPLKKAGTEGHKGEWVDGQVKPGLYFLRCIEDDVSSTSSPASTKSAK